MVATAQLTNNFLAAGDSVTLAVEGKQVTLRATKGGWTEASRGLGAEMWQQAGGSKAIEAERASWD